MTTTEEIRRAIELTHEARELVGTLGRKLFALQGREAMAALVDLQRAEAGLTTLHALRVPAPKERAA